MNYRNSIIIGGLAVVLAVGAGIFALHAHAAQAASDDCAISAADIAQLSAIQNDSTLTYAQEESKELALRQQLVGGTIACAQQEVQSLQATLASTTVSDGAAALQQQLTSRLNDATDFYNIESAKLNGSGISGTEIVAREVLAWREGSFEPLANQISNFILWSQNQALFDTAGTRMDQTSRAVTFLESASPNSALQTAFNTSLADFNKAQSENASAKADLEQGLSAGQTLGEIKGSLDSLAATYQDFASVSTAIKGILPQ